jgi:hypothetical protein
MDPVPESRPPAETVTLPSPVAEPEVFTAFSVPPETVVLPVYVFAPDRFSVPWPETVIPFAIPVASLITLEMLIVAPLAALMTELGAPSVKSIALVPPLTLSRMVNVCDELLL